MDVVDGSSATQPVHVPYSAIVRSSSQPGHTQLLGSSTHAATAGSRPVALRKSPCSCGSSAQKQVSQCSRMMMPRRAEPSDLDETSWIS